MTLRRILPLALIALTLGATGASAQATVATAATAATADLATPIAHAPLAATPTETATPIAGPRLDQGRTGIAAVREAASSAPTPVPQEISRRRGVPQMIIGGAAILGGALIGDDAGSIISVAGLVYGLYGLYLYLQ